MISVMSRLIVFNTKTGDHSILAQSFNQSLTTRARFNINLSFVWSLHYHAPSNCILMVDKNHGIIILNLVTGSEKIIGAQVEISKNTAVGYVAASIFSRPHGVCTKPNGNIVIADTQNHMIKEVNMKIFSIKIIAGKKTPGFSGDGGPSKNSILASPHDVACNKNGEIFIADTANHKIRRINNHGRLDTVVGCAKNHIDSNQDILKSEHSTPLEAHLRSPHSITFDNESCLLISDTLNNRVCRADFFKNTFETIAGGIYKENNDDDAESIHPHGATADQENNLLIADRDNNKIRFVAKNTNVITTLIGETPSAKIFFPLNAPQAITTDLKQNIFVVDSNIS